MPTTTPMYAPLRLRPGRALSKARRPAPRRLTVADRAALLTLRAVRRLAGVRIVFARTPVARADAEAVLAAVAGPPAPIPADLTDLHRRYADMAYTFVAYVGRRPVGTMTLYLPVTRSRTVDSAPVVLPAGVHPRDVIDIGRLAILPEHRGGARLVMLSLLDAAHDFSRRIGRTWWVGMTAAGLVSVFNRLNHTTRPLRLAGVDRRPGPLVRYWRAYRGGRGTDGLAPFILEVDQTVPSRVIGEAFAAALRRRRRAQRPDAS